MVDIPGYRIGQLIHESRRTRVYRAVRRRDDLPVVIKVLAAERPSERSLARFQLGFQLGRRIVSDAVIRHLELIPTVHGLALLTEDYGAQSLDRLPTADLSSLERLLRLSVALAKGVGDIHEHDIVHKDIKPSNVVMNIETGVLKIIDFGISSSLSREHPALAPPGKIEGSLAYISPEQTGRMNRTVDWRSDLYSLGATLYELFTGTLPFSTVDPVELIHCHLARTPSPPAAAGVPAAISAIIERLMAKTAEDRYQSAFGVRRDLERCLDAIVETGRIESFEIASSDISGRFQLPQRLYGRETELRTLLDAFARVGEGRRELLLVTGDSGIGKSALIREVHKPIIEHRGYFCAGKFDQFRRDLPYQALVDALRGLLRQILAEHDARVDEVRRALEDALGLNGAIVVDLLPELEQIVGPQPDVPALSSAEAQNRFNRVFAHFLGVFARPEHPLTIVLDDLQWADVASLELMKILTSGSRLGSLFIVGAYRHDEVSEIHPLVEMLEATEATGQRVERLHLQPLGESSIVRYVADALVSDLPRATPLGRLVAELSGGNPFFVAEFLSSLYRDGHLNFDSDAGQWTWDMPSIAALETTDDVVELVAAKLRRLDEEAQHVIGLASCVGSRFDLATLALSRGSSKVEAARALEPVLVEGFILPTDDSYKYMTLQGAPHAGGQTTRNARYRFLHDRVHQAAYSLLGGDERKRHHLEIGRVLDENVGPDGRGEMLVSIANHFDLGRDLVTDPAAKRRMGHLHLEAGHRAKASLAFAPAAHYLRSGIGLLTSAAWETDYEVALHAHVAAAEALTQLERYAEVEALVETILGRTRDVLDAVPAHKVRMVSAMAQRDPARALDLVVDVVEMLGVSIPRKPQAADVSAEMAQTLEALGGRGRAELADLPAMTDRRLLAAMEILADNAAAAYVTDGNVLVVFILKMVQLAVAHGNSSLAAQAYEYYGMFLCGAFGDAQRGHEFGVLGFEVFERFPDPAMTGKMWVAWGCLIAPWSDPPVDCARALMDAWRPAVDGGDLENAGYCVLQGFTITVLAGRPLHETLERFDDYLAWLRGSKQVMSTKMVNCWAQVVAHLMDDSRVVSRLCGDLVDTDRQLAGWVAEGDLMHLAFAGVSEGTLAYLTRDLDRAEIALELAAKHIDQLFSTFAIPAVALYTALTHCGLAHRGSGDRRTHLRIAEESLAKLRNWARINPGSFEHKARLVEAEIARVRGRHAEADRHYEMAAQLAQASGFLNDEALSHELRGMAWLDHGGRDVAGLFLARARRVYQAWGAVAKVRQLDQLHGSLLQDAPLSWQPPIAAAEARSTVDVTVTTSSTVGKELDYASVSKASRAISSEIELPRLVARMLDIIVEAAGAERAHLVVERDSELRVLVPGEAGDLRDVALDEVDTLSPAVVRFVARTGESVVLGAADDEGAESSPVPVGRKVKSLLCMPILRQGVTAGVLYLENDLTRHAFSTDRLELLAVLLSQAAVSLENAQLFQDLAEANERLEEEVARRTQELRQTLQSLERSHLELDAFVRVASHDLRAPLRQVRSLGKRLTTLSEGRLDARGQEYLDRMTSSAARMEEMLEGLLALTVIGASPANMTPVVLGALVASVLEDFESEIERTSAVIDVGELPTINGDHVQLRQLFQNLISNALKYRRDDVAPRVRIASAVDDDDMLRVCVEDNGIGVSEEHRESIFQVFERLHGRSTYPGTGVGLAICRKIVERHGGHIRAHGTPGSGTTFVVTLPA